jgi:hypothetical protein
MVVVQVERRYGMREDGLNRSDLLSVHQEFGDYAAG